MHGSEDNGPSGGRRGASASRRRHPGEASTPAGRPDVEPADEPLYVLTREQSRRVDELSTSEFAMPSILLMENAALGVASVAREVCARRADPAAPARILVFCGPGNNGGDGLATARHLANDGSRITVVLACEPHKFKGDALTNLEITRRMGVPILVADRPDRSPAAVVEQARAAGEPDLVIDALLGTGLDRPAGGVMADLIGRMNELRASGVPVLSVDVPSGMDADSGAAPIGEDGRSGPIVRATVTVALLGLKPGYLTLAAQEFLGDCLVASIGAPRSLIEQIGRRYAPPTGSGSAGGS